MPTAEWKLKWTGPVNWVWRFKFVDPRPNKPRKRFAFPHSMEPNFKKSFAPMKNPLLFPIVFPSEDNSKMKPLAKGPSDSLPAIWWCLSLTTREEHNKFPKTLWTNQTKLNMFLHTANT